MMIELSKSAAMLVSGARAVVLEALGLNRVEWTSDLPQSVRLRAEYASIFERDLREGSSKLVRVVDRRSANA